MSSVQDEWSGMDVEEPGVGVSAAVLVGQGCVRAWVTGLPCGRALCKGRVQAGLMVGTGLLLRY